eukprot:jgi/Tetstr1/441442/TSEL_029688.t1
MRVPYQQLKQHVAAWPSGMHNEYLRCLFGEHAPASGHAAVRALPEFASMYLQVGEAERRAVVAERAVVDNMKKAYVSCDNTLEVTYGAARFNADDGYLVGLPEHIWPALHAFRTSIKASVGLEVRFDKMHAYIADMEAARREAPADIEWPELDGHHDIPAEELREEVDASLLSKLIPAKPSRRYTHALHHHAWALLKHCMQRKAGYWLRNCLSSEVEAFAEAVDATVHHTAAELVLGVSFDPSTYGTDTNPVVTDFMAELLHDPNPLAVDAATLSEAGAVTWARIMLHLPSRMKAAGIRRVATVRDAAFIGCMNDILPSFNATSSAHRYDHFLNDAHGSDSYAEAVRKACGRLHAATAGDLSDADARVMEREAKAASG